jgi:hypothetical protein
VEGVVSWFNRASRHAEPPPPAATRWDVVTGALASGDLDAASAELLDWFDAAVTADVEHDNAHRTDCRQVVDRAAAFLEVPGGGAHRRADAVFDGMARVVYEARDVMTVDNTAAFTRALRRRQGLAVPGPDHPSIPADDVAFLTRYGRYRFLGWEAAGEPGPIDWYPHLMRWFEPLMAGPPARDRVVSHLNRLAGTHGGWVAVGAWKVLLEFSPDLADEGHEALASCLRAYRAFGVTNLASYIPPVELTIWWKLFDGVPPNDGFFRPPVFSTSDGPQRVDYLRAAAAVAASRRPRRLQHVPGVPPGPIEAGDTNLVHSMWDFGQLVLIGAHVMNEERRYERAVLARSHEWAHGVDHTLVLDHLVETVGVDDDPAWSAVGSARFCEEYLDVSLTSSEAHRSLLEAGLDFLERQNLLRSSIATACLSSAELEGLRRRGHHV